MMNIMFMKSSSVLYNYPTQWHKQFVNRLKIIVSVFSFLVSLQRTGFQWGLQYEWDTKINGVQALLKKRRMSSLCSLSSTQYQFVFTKNYTTM